MASKTSHIPQRASQIVTITEQIWTAVLNKQAADKVLKRHFTKEKRFGSRDRKIISHYVFNIFRWHGWVQKIVDTDPAFDSWPFRLWLTANLAPLVKYQEMHEQLLAHWQSESNQTAVDSYCPQPFDSSDLTLMLNQKKDWLQNAYAVPSLNSKNLLPAWYQNQIPLEEENWNSHISYLQTNAQLWIRTSEAQSEESNSLQESLTEMEFAATKKLAQSWYRKEAYAQLQENKFYKNGLIEVQDLASQCIGHVVASFSPKTLWDNCCGAGGKSLHFMDLLSDSEILCSDVRPHALEQFKKRLKRSSLSSLRKPTIKMHDARNPHPFGEHNIDCIFIDAPCSGTGTWRRSPDARWRTTEISIREVQSLQLEILNASATQLRPGGILIYATCSLTELENTNVCKIFEAAHPSYAQEKFKHPITNSEINGKMWIYPENFNNDGMFVSVWRKK
jgi:16S rRNA (cytosine967-C5)-methyltransferase